MKKNNKGFSLVELIIVIAIIAVILGTAFFSLNLVFGANAKTCANDIKNAIAQGKINAMGKSNAYVEIFRDTTDQCIYARQCILENGTWAIGEAELISNARVYVGFVPEGGTETELAPGDSVRISFDRGSGSFREFHDGATVAPVYSEVLVRGGTRAYRLVLTKLTGKVNIEAE